MEPTQAFARFPLVARPRPACAPLDARVGNLCELARTAERDSDTSTASTVFNQAALLASDLGLPDLARTWCHQHAALYLTACPLTGRAARHALEPLVNLARLYIRAGDGARAFALLDGLYEAAQARTDTTIDGLRVPFSTLTQTAADHRDVLQWLWAVHLADGTRALTGAGRWNDALAHLRARNGVGHRMLDGRQVAVIAHALAGDTATTQALLDGTPAGEPWEAAVTACLAALCRPGDDRTAAEMLTCYRRLDHTAPGLVVFRTRLGLSVVDAAGGVDTADGRAVATTLIIRAVATDDGYAARDVLDHPGCAAILKADQKAALTQLLQASGLGSRRFPEWLMVELSVALSRSGAVIARNLNSCLVDAERMG
ncbi:hypothetical protein DI270_007585 [Microbispora triticiradicis]|uniref:XRE family transcriptional regulator n=1 Tax=Microbispora triticiradicis TaxID=2200763 RepID=A0ABX9LNS8_9ACTN|nr:hypothetical protein [Microbispora triticiradicis]RGA05565.1 hypothetical protein DI270_007585 [Microbispora triticiradicis]